MAEQEATKKRSQDEVYVSIKDELVEFLLDLPFASLLMSKHKGSSGMAVWAKLNIFKHEC